MNILFIINNGFEDIEFSAPYDILKRAGFNVIVASNNISAISSHGLTITNLKILKDIDYKSFDMLVLPGGPEWKDNQNDSLYLSVMSYYAENKAIASICATPTILGDHGYLKGKRYTCFPPMHKDSCGGIFTSSSVERDGNIITGRSAGAGYDFGFAIVEYLEGKDKVKEVMQSMYY